ncbi:hypothetical protein [Gordonia hongkongensis]|uniref:hypothetical protein n=1 Tax=Gordonia hongkongensis TaxID=1701090 RepID=UPI003EC0AAC0
MNDNPHSINDPQPPSQFPQTGAPRTQKNFWTAKNLVIVSVAAVVVLVGGYFAMLQVAGLIGAGAGKIVADDILEEEYGAGATSDDPDGDGSAPTRAVDPEQYRESLNKSLAYLFEHKDQSSMEVDETIDELYGMVLPDEDDISDPNLSRAQAIVNAQIIDLYTITTATDKSEARNAVSGIVYPGSAAEKKLLAEIDEGLPIIESWVIVAASKVFPSGSFSDTFRIDGGAMQLVQLKNANGDMYQRVFLEFESADGEYVSNIIMGTFEPDDDDYVGDVTNWKPESN